MERRSDGRVMLQPSLVPRITDDQPASILIGATHSLLTAQRDRHPQVQRPTHPRAGAELWLPLDVEEVRNIAYQNLAGLIERQPIVAGESKWVGPRPDSPLRD